jgi:phenylpyruvate tautomerase PptA (4-oxalocrotonate tautomerase family)
MIEVQVSVREDISPENKKKTVEGITKVFEDLGVPKEAVKITIYEVPKSAHELSNEIIIVQVSVREDISPENKKKTVEGITKVFEDLGVPKEAVEITIYEVPKPKSKHEESATWWPIDRRL